MAEASATAIALVRRGCIWTLSLRFSVLNNKWKHRRPTRLREGADSKASQPVFPSRRVLSGFCERQVKGSSKLRVQTENVYRIVPHPGPMTTLERKHRLAHYFAQALEVMCGAALVVLM